VSVVDAFPDRVALVTGAASGIGTATARRLAGLGAKVIVVDLSEAGVGAVADEIGATPIVMDVSEPDAWDRLIAQATADFGGIDFAHLNAGTVTMPYPYRIVDMTVAHYRRLMGVNVDGVVLATTKLVPVMAERGGGAIVATGSTAAFVPFTEDPYYSASKAAIVSFVRSSAPQLAELGVRIHTICPGLVQTNMIRDFVEKRAGEFPMPALDPAEVAAAVADMLATDDTGLVRTIRVGEGVRDYDFGNGVSSPPG
jgi:NAD(P)-dependent dehydrogenase (short-subunit alcohol dehydrogenase family)